MPPTRYGSSINSIDDSAAKDIRGYQQTIAIEDPSGTIQGWGMVIADSFPAAMKAAEAVSVDWTPGPTADVSDTDIQDEGVRLAGDRSAGALFLSCHHRELRTPAA